MKPKSSLRSVLALAGSSLLAITCAHAINWIGGDGTWNLAGNWSPSGIPNATNADVFFIGSSNQNITLDGGYTIRTLGFSNTGITNIRGNSSGTSARTLTTLGSGITVNSGAGAVTIGDTPGTYGAVNIALGANNTWTNNSENLLTFTGDVTNNGTFTHTIGGSGNTAISGAINTGAVALTKTGFGTLTLSGANGYTGGTFVNGGKLVLDMNSGGSLNSASTLQVGAAAPAGTFEIKGKSGAFVSSQTMGNLSLGNNAYLKIVLDPNNATGGNGTTLTLGDVVGIGGPSALIIDYSSSNTGTREVVTANATSGSGGALLDGIYQKILVKDTNGVTGFGTRAAGSNQAFTRYDDATLATTLTSAIPTSSTVNYTTLGAGASVVMTNVTRTINSLVVDTTDNAFALDTGANALTIETAILFRGDDNATIDGGTINTQYIHQVGTGELTINNVIAGAGTLLGKTGAGTLVLSGNNTFTGAMNISEGILKLGAAGNGTQSPLGTAAGGTLINAGGALDLNGITLSTAEALTLIGNGVANGGALTNSGANASYSGLLTISAPTSIVSSGGDINLTNGGTVNIVNGLTVGGAKNTSIASILSGTATPLLPTALTKQGTGTLTLSASNTYTGGTILNAGTLKLDYAATNTSKLSNTATYGTLLLNGGTLELSGGSHLETVLSTTLNTGGTFIKQTNSGTSTLSMGAITFTGGAIDFSAGSIATTTSTVTNGILSQRATLGGTNFAMKSGSNIVAYDYAASGSTGYTGAAMSADTNYELTANGASTLSGATGDTSNTLKIANTATGSLDVGANALTLGAILFAGSADYDITTSGSGSVSPSILHNFGTGGAVLNLGALGGALSQFGTGKTILNNDATAAGGLAVNGGTVQISSNAQIGLVASGAGISLNNGTLLASETLTLDNSGANKRAIALGAGGGTLAAASTKTLTVSGVISGELNSLTIGSGGSNGTVVLSGTNTYTGATTISAGTLLLSSTGSTHASSAVTVNSGGALGGDGSVGGSATFNEESIFSWNLSVDTPASTVSSTVSDTMAVAGNLVDGGNAGGSVFKILLAGSQTFADTFWNASHSWSNVLTSGNTFDLANLFTSFSYANAGGTIDAPTTGSFSLSGSTLSYTFTAIPEPTTALAGLLLAAGLLRRRRTA
jgi:autotransporter-associated beta strand protein